MRRLTEGQDAKSRRLGLIEVHISPDIILNKKVINNIIKNNIIMQ